jgi:hypothetical protein
MVVERNQGRSCQAPPFPRTKESRSDPFSRRSPARRRGIYPHQLFEVVETEATGSRNFVMQGRLPVENESCDGESKFI